MLVYKHTCSHAHRIIIVVYLLKHIFKNSIKNQFSCNNLNSKKQHRLTSIWKLFKGSHGLLRLCRMNSNLAKCYVLLPRIRSLIFNYFMRWTSMTEILLKKSKHSHIKYYTFLQFKMQASLLITRVWKIENC